MLKKVFKICICHFPPPPKVNGGYVFTHVCLSVCEQNMSKKIQTASNETSSTAWQYDEDKLIRFWWRSASGYENFSSDSIHHWEMGPKPIESTIFQKVVEALWGGDKHKPIWLSFRSRSRSGFSVRYKTSTFQPGGGMRSIECRSGYICVQAL